MSRWRRTGTASCGRAGQHSGVFLLYTSLAPVMRAGSFIMPAVLTISGSSVLFVPCEIITKLIAVFPLHRISLIFLIAKPLGVL